MLTAVQVNDFHGIPYLESSLLMQAHKGKIRFSTKKPNVVVGPNGSGKSALLTSLAIRFLAYFTPQSRFESGYTDKGDGKHWWTRARSWGDDYEFLKGLEVSTDNGPALYYRPGHIPGNENSIASAMMCGYFDQAKEFGRLTKNKSAGQANLALLDRMIEALAGRALPQGYEGLDTWSFGAEPRQLKTAQGYVGSWDWQAEVLKRQIAPAKDAVPLILMDEPEQSLDAREEARLWKAIEQADCSRMQVLVATHSTYPLLRPSKFNIIEAESGFSAEVAAMYGQGRG